MTDDRDRLRRGGFAVVVAGILIVGVVTLGAERQTTHTVVARSADQGVAESWRPEAIVSAHLDGERRRWPAPVRMHYSVRHLGVEVSDANRVLKSAELEQAQHFVFELDSSGDYLLLKALPTGEVMPREVFMFSMVDHVGRTWTGGQLDGAIRDRSAYVAAGGESGTPGASLGPFGAVTPLASAEQLLASGEGARTLEVQACGPVHGPECVRAIYEFPVGRPSAGSEHYRSLPWREHNIERREIVYDPRTLDVWSITESINGKVTHQQEIHSLERMPATHRIDVQVAVAGPASALAPSASHPVELVLDGLRTEVVTYSQWESSR